jgi:hypothetical protein
MDNYSRMILAWELKTDVTSASIAAPPRTTIGKITARLWTAADITKVRTFKGTLKAGRLRGMRFLEGYKPKAR